jgi:phosphoserine phosphatase RsbU/P
MQALPATTRPTGGVKRVGSGPGQLSLFSHPLPATRQTLDVHATSIPARAFTGDFYFVHHADDRFLFALGDVAGKGLNAAVFMAMIQEELDRTSCDDPSADMMRLHTFLKPLIPLNRFATAVVGQVAHDGAVKLANAGHCPPLVLRSDGSVEEIASTGPVLGVLSSSQWRTFETTLRRGESLVLYSDGVIETRSQDGEEFGTRRLIAALNGNDSETIAASVLKAVHDYGKTEDDLTLLVIRR